MFHEPRFWTSLAFVLFFVLFGKRLWSVIASHLDGRAAGVRADLDEAARLRREAEQMLEDATREREKTLADTQAMLARSQAEAAELAERARRDAQSAASRFEKMARDRIEAAERAAIREVQERAISIAVAAARDVVATHLDKNPDIATKLLSDSIDSLPAVLRRSAA